MKKIKWPKLVLEEAKNLKKFATKTELDNLDFNRLEPDAPYACIYGQITQENCYHPRAIELIEKCCSRVYKSGESHQRNGRLSCDLNGNPKNSKRSAYWSPIEVFICNPGNQTNGANERLIAYLKGEKRTLK